MSMSWIEKKEPEPTKDNPVWYRGWCIWYNELAIHPDESYAFNRYNTRAIEGFAPTLSVAKDEIDITEDSPDV